MTKYAKSEICPACQGKAKLLGISLDGTRRPYYGCLKCGLWFTLKKAI